MNDNRPPMAPPPMPGPNPNYIIFHDQETEEQKVERAKLFANLIGPTLIYAILYTFFIYRNFAGITMPLFSLATVIYSFYCFKIYKVNLKLDSYLYAAVIVLLGVSSCLTGSVPIITFNTIGICLMLLCMLLHNFFNDKDWNLSKYTGAIFMSIIGAIMELPTPFSDISNYEKHKTNKSKGLYVLIGLVIAFPLLIIIVALLYYADAVFADVINTIFKNISILNIFGILFTFGFAFLSAYCGIRYIGKHELSEEVKDNRNFNSIIAITVLSLISIIYLLFSGIQILYLFIGNMQLPDGYTYATYAHEGFFQLLFVCILNVVIVIFTMSFFKENLIVKLLLTVISLCTYIMLASSAMRMWLYVENYSLTVLRVFVFWALLVLAILLVGIVIQIFKKNFHLFRYGLAIVCFCYLILSFGHMDYWIAKFNLGYVASNDGTVDYNYLTNLSSDAAPIIAAEDGDWVELYAFRQVKYAEDGIRKFNFSHNNAIKAFSKYVSMHKDYYCLTFSAFDDEYHLSSDDEIISAICEYVVVDTDNSLVSIPTECITNPITKKPVFIAYVPKDFCKLKKNSELSVSFEITFKSGKKSSTDKCSFYPMNGKIHDIKAEISETGSYIYLMN